jgi:hypothetical protein
LAAPTITSIRAHDAFKSQTICAGVLNAGKHDISIEIDANNTIAESSDLDNNYTAQVTILPTGVDLVADKYQENWESPIALFDMNGDMLLGTNLTEGILSIQAGIKNQGSALQNPGWKASLYIDDKIVTTKSLPIIGSGQKVIISTDQVLKNGEHTAKLVIDYGNSIAEKDETNNEYSLTFTVNDPDLVFVLPKPTGPTLIKDYSQPARYSSVESKGVVSYYWFFSDESLYDSIVYSANKMYVDVYWKEYNGKNTSLLVYPIFKNKNYGLQSPYIVISLDGGVDYAAPSGDTVINDLEKYYTYTATAVDGATSYQWNVSGFTDTIISSDGSQISVLWDITHNVSTINLSSKAVFADSIQPSFSDVLSVKINAISDVILGDSLINDFQRNFTYTAPNNPDAVSYEWSVYPKYVKSSSSSLFGGLQYMIGWNIISMGAIAHLQARPVYKDGTKGEYCEPFKVTLANSKGEFIAANPAPPKGEAVICDRSAHFRYVAQEVPNAVSYWVCDDVKKNYYATYTEKGASKNEFMFTSINDTVIDTVRIYITTLDDQGKLQSISDVLEIVLGGNPSAEPIETVGDLLFCENITVELSAKASAGSTILWSSGQSDAKISVNAGTFSYTATEAGCVAYSDTITIVMPTRNEITAQVVPVTICPGQTANVTTTDNVKRGLSVPKHRLTNREHILTLTAISNAEL